MSKALDIINPNKLSMSVIFTAMNHLINESNALQTDFINGNYPNLLCKTMGQYIKYGGGEVVMYIPAKDFFYQDNNINRLLMKGSSEVV